MWFLSLYYVSLALCHLNSWHSLTSSPFSSPWGVSYTHSWKSPYRTPHLLLASYWFAPSFLFSLSTCPSILHLPLFPPAEKSRLLHQALSFSKSLLCSFYLSRWIIQTAEPPFNTLKESSYFLLGYLGLYIFSPLYQSMQYQPTQLVDPFRDHSLWETLLRDWTFFSSSLVILIPLFLASKIPPFEWLLLWRP